MKLLKAQAEFYDYLEAEKNATTSTLSSYKGDFKIFNQFLKDNNLGDDVKKIDVPDIRKYIVYMKQTKGYKNETIRRKINSLRSFFKYMGSQDYVTKDPMRGITAPKKEQNMPLFFKEDEVNLLLKLAKFNKGSFALRDYILIKIIAVTGIRRAEAVGLNFDDVDFNEHTLKVRGKGRKERIVPMNEEFCEELWMYSQSRLPIKNNAMFISSTGKRIQYSRIHIVFTDLLKRAGLHNKGYSLHTLRHSYATHLANNGVDILAIKELLGHADIGTTTIYSNMTTTFLKEKIKNLPY